MEIKYSEDMQHAYFDNIEFYKKENYYANHVFGRLHRYVWGYYNGIIPENYCIHHIDFNRSNNDISNLELITREEHNKLHALDSNLGKYNRSPEHKKAISEFAKNKPEEMRNKFIYNRIGKEPYNKGVKLTNEEARQKMKLAQTGKKNSRWIEITEGMKQDYRNNISRKDFLEKYNVSSSIWDKIKKVMLGEKNETR